MGWNARNRKIPNNLTQIEASTSLEKGEDPSGLKNRSFKDQIVVKPWRMIGFASYFKQYMGISSLITAILPLPVTAWGLIPTFSVQTRFLSVYTSLFCFLLLSLVFFVRHKLVGVLFRRRVDGHIGNGWFFFVPPALIVSSILLIFFYHMILNKSLYRLSDGNTALSSVTILQSADIRAIPYGISMVAIYLCMFLSAEGAFILMATKEYLQDSIGISDADLFATALAPHGWCTTFFYSDSNGAFGSLIVDGKFVGQIECRVQLPPGEHSIIVKKDGFRTWSTKIMIASNELSRDIHVQLEASVASENVPAAGEKKKSKGAGGSGTIPR